MVNQPSTSSPNETSSRLNLNESDNESISLSDETVKFGNNDYEEKEIITLTIRKRKIYKSGQCSGPCEVTEEFSGKKDELFGFLDRISESVEDRKRARKDDGNQ